MEVSRGRRWDRPTASPEAWMVIVRYAVRDGRGKVLRCEPQPGESKLCYAVRRELAKSDGKVIYPSVAVAEEAADELLTLGFGRSDQTAYPCRRAEHAHLGRALRSATG